MSFSIFDEFFEKDKNWGFTCRSKRASSKYKRVFDRNRVKTCIDFDDQNFRSLIELTKNHSRSQNNRRKQVHIKHHSPLVGSIIMPNSVLNRAGCSIHKQTQQLKNEIQLKTNLTYHKKFS